MLVVKTTGGFIRWMNMQVWQRRGLWVMGDRLWIGQVRRQAVTRRRKFFCWHSWVAYEDPFWKEQTIVPIFHVRAMLAALFHYIMHAADVMCFLRGTYTGEHCDVNAIIIELNSHDIDSWFISQYIQTTTVGCPNHFMAETTRENALFHWREGNHTSVAKNMVEVLSTMANEHKNRYNMPLSCYTIRYLPHGFTTPQYMLWIAIKDPRLIFDAAKRSTAISTPINMMTSMSQGTEHNCLHGNVQLLPYE